MYLGTIEKKAQSILSELKIESTPTPIRKIAISRGLVIKHFDFGDEISGTLVIKDKQGIIGLNPSESGVRQRFTIAHELGHFELHKDNDLFVDKEFKVHFRNQVSATGEIRHEQEANSFAAAILMPKNLLESKIKKLDLDLTDEHAIKELAKIFDVSAISMTYRIANLNLF